METLLLSEITEQPSKVAKETRASWFQYRYEITCMKSATRGPESLPSSPRRSPKNKFERRPERSLGHSSEVSNSNWKHHSKPRTKRRASSMEKNNQPTLTAPPFGVPTRFAGLTSARSKSTKKKAHIYGMEMQATTPISVASSTGLTKSTAAEYESDTSPLIQLPPALSYSGSNSADRADLKAISTSLFNLQRVNTQATQQSLKMHAKALAMKKMKDPAMAAQTKDTIRTTRVILLSMEGYKGQLIIADNLPFSTYMMNLTELPGLPHIANQVLQIT